jgi:hypothetical protein
MCRFGGYNIDDNSNVVGELGVTFGICIRWALNGHVF